MASMIVNLPPGVIPQAALQEVDFKPGPREKATSVSETLVMHCRAVQKALLQVGLGLVRRVARVRALPGLT